MGSHAKLVETSMKVKFRALFDKINEPNYVMDNYYSDNLLNKIVETRKDNNYICFLSELLAEPIQNLEKYHVSVQVFLVRLLAFCVSKELFWTKLMNSLDKPLREVYSNITSPTMNPSLCVAYLEVALFLVEQHTGLYWIIESGIWKEILSTGKESRTVFVTRQKYKFGSKLVWKLNSLDDEVNLKEVLNFILKPLIEMQPTMVESTVTTEVEEEAAKQLEPVIHMLVAIMSEHGHLTKSSLVVNIRMNYFKVTNHTYMMLNRFRKDSLVGLVGKLSFRLTLAKVLHNKPLTDDTVHTAEDFIETGAVYFNTINNYLTRGKVMMVLDYCYSCYEIWNGIWRKKSNVTTLDGKKVDLRNKMLFLCLVPQIAFITRHLPNSVIKMEECIQDYIMKLINASCEHTAKTAMRLSQLTLEQDTEAIVLQSVKRLSSLTNSMNNEQANLMFQGLYYVLKKFEPGTEEQNGTPESKFQEDQENLFMYTYVLEAIFLIVRDYNINWHDSLEVICLYNLVYNVLQKPNLSSKKREELERERRCQL